MKMTKRVVIVAAALALVTAGCRGANPMASADSAAVAAPVKAIRLTDINSHWAKDNIQKAIEKGYIDGYEDQTFRPDTNVSRAEFIKMTVTALKLNVAPAAAGDSWYVPFVNVALKAGIHRSNDFSTGDWSTPISRLEMSKISIRATTPSLQDPAIRMDDDSYVYNSTKAGLMQGLNCGKLAVDDPTTRAQSVTVIERILSVKNGEKLPVDKYAIGNAELKLKHTNIFTVIPEFFGGEQFNDGKWDITNQGIETPDGGYKAGLDELVAIDMDDPQDPNRYLLGDISQLHWFNLMYGINNPYISNFPHSYILFFKSHVDYVKDPETYNTSAKGILFAVMGTDSPNRKEFIKGTLNDVAAVFKDELGDVPAVIIPKTGFIIRNGNLSIDIMAPAIGSKNNYRKSILHVLEKQ